MAAEAHSGNVGSEGGATESIYAQDRPNFSQAGPLLQGPPAVRWARKRPVGGGYGICATVPRRPRATQRPACELSEQLGTRSSSRCELCQTPEARGTSGGTSNGRPQLGSSEKRSCQCSALPMERQSDMRVYAKDDLRERRLFDTPLFRILSAMRVSLELVL